MTRFTSPDGFLQYYYISSALGVLHLELMKRVAAQGILLTMCPLSDVVLGCVDKAEQLPIGKFLDLLDRIPH